VTLGDSITLCGGGTAARSYSTRTIAPRLSLVPQAHAQSPTERWAEHTPPGTRGGQGTYRETTMGRRCSFPTQGTSPHSSHSPDTAVSRSLSCCWQARHAPPARMWQTEAPGHTRTRARARTRTHLCGWSSDGRISLLAARRLPLAPNSGKSFPPPTHRGGAHTWRPLTGASHVPPQHILCSQG